MAMVIEQCFNADGRRFIRIGKSSASWSRTRGNYSWNKKQLISHINYLIDNIYVTCCENLVIGIPMGTDCAPFLANLFHYSFEVNGWITRCKRKSLTPYINSTTATDILMTFCASTTIKQWTMLRLKSIRKNVVWRLMRLFSANYFDLRIEIRNNKIHTSLFDKRDAFGFKIVNWLETSQQSRVMAFLYHNLFDMHVVVKTSKTFTQEPWFWSIVLCVSTLRSINWRELLESLLSLIMSY